MNINSRKIQHTSVGRHFSQWKIRRFSIESSILIVYTDSSGTKIIWPLDQICLKYHFYSSDSKHQLLSLKYSDTAVNALATGYSNYHSNHRTKHLPDSKNIEKGSVGSEKSVDIKNLEIMLEFPSDEEMNKFESILLDAISMMNVNNNTASTETHIALREFFKERLQLQQMQILQSSDVVVNINEGDDATVTDDDSLSIDSGSDPLKIEKIENLLKTKLVFHDSNKSPGNRLPVPKLNIVLMVVGTRGDVQPFGQIGLRLQKDGHRIRLATHEIFRDYVIGLGLEFYPLGADPHKLSEFMVKTHGNIIPSLSDLVNEVPQNLRMINEIIFSTWGACTEPDPQDPLQKSFIADAIISNPVTYGHIHCAEALSIPIHLMFPQPWLPTKAFPHPLSCMSYQNPWSLENYLSYNMVDQMFWLTSRGMINDFRVNVLDLPKIGHSGWNLISKYKIPFAKMWSPHIAPKPKDWPDHVDITGIFYDQPVQKSVVASSDDTQSEPSELTKLFNSIKPEPPPPGFKPSAAFQSFLDRTFNESLPKPILITFGSMVIEDPVTIFRDFLDAAALANQRIILQVGWSKISQSQFQQMATDAQKKAQVVNNTIAGNECSVIFPSNTTFDEDSFELLEDDYVNIDPDEELTKIGAVLSSSYTEHSSSSLLSEVTRHLPTWLPFMNSSKVPVKESIKPPTAVPKPNSNSPTYHLDDIDFESIPLANSWSAERDAVLLEACPHSWLFQHVGAIIHHGGAGTTSSALRSGLPSWIIPFFGDQHFWGEMIHRHHLGPPPCPIQDLNMSKIAENLSVLTRDDIIKNVTEVATKLRQEDGVEGAVSAFYRHLPVEGMICDVKILSGEMELAQIYCHDCDMKMCIEVSKVIHSKPENTHHHLEPCRYCQWSFASDPTKTNSPSQLLISGISNIVTEITDGVGEVIYHPVKGVYDDGLTGGAIGLKKGLVQGVAKPLSAGGNALLQKLSTGLGKEKRRRSLTPCPEMTSENLQVSTSKTTICQSGSAKLRDRVHNFIHDKSQDLHGHEDDAHSECASLVDELIVKCFDRVDIGQIESSFQQAKDIRSILSSVSKSNSRYLSVKDFALLVEKAMSSCDFKHSATDPEITSDTVRNVKSLIQHMGEPEDPQDDITQERLVNVRL